MNALKHQQSRKIAFYLRGFTEHFLVLDRYYRFRLKRWLARQNRYDRDEVFRRVNYYNKLDKPFTIPREALRIGQIQKEKATYLFDFRRIMRYFPADVRSYARFGDITDVSEVPSFVKTRPIDGPNENSVLLRLNSIRHFRPITDHTPYRQKKDTLVWRGMVKPNHPRSALFEKFFGHPLLDIGMSKGRVTPEMENWQKPYLSIPEQLQHKFILSVEGNDVATNLKWIAQSNSLCFMTKPKYESWFMEGTLQAGKHYVQVRDDYTDLPEKITHYINHPDEAEAIIHEMSCYYKRFTDTRKEQLIGLLVAEKYLRLSGQLHKAPCISSKSIS
ncbi:MAG: lipopolysaccharide A protein [Verrucomicrobia bacterium]|jgi:hypothetical protein|nr:lipopolysaccharide A protein [Verrucomicrobiota bacterium]